MKKQQIYILTAILILSVISMMIFKKRIEGFKDDDKKDNDNSGDAQAVTFYTECRYKGNSSTSLKPGKYTSADMNTNKITVIKSFKSKGNFQIRLYPLDNFQGTPKVYTNSENCLEPLMIVKSIIILQDKHSVYVDTPLAKPIAPSTSTTVSSELPSSTLPTTSQPATPSPRILPPPPASPASEYVVMQHIIPIETTIPSTYAPVNSATSSSPSSASVDNAWVPVPANA